MKQRLERLKRNKPRAITGPRKEKRLRGRLAMNFSIITAKAGQRVER